jgi:predicted methyltransferase
MKRFIALLLFATSAFPQVAETANRNYQTKEGRESVARGLADPHRDDKQKPRELVEAMGLKAGQSVADVGTGVGYMLPYLSKAVGPTGHVTAEDIQQDFLDKAKLRVRTVNLNNVTFVLGTDKDPKLPGDTFNAVLVLDTYHHFDYPESMLAAIRDSLLTGGRFYLVDYYKSPTAMPGGRAMEHIRLDRDDVAFEVESNGFRLVSKSDHIPNSQYMLVFEKK